MSAPRAGSAAAPQLRHSPLARRRCESTLTFAQSSHRSTWLAPLLFLHQRGSSGYFVVVLATYSFLSRFRFSLRELSRPPFRSLSRCQPVFLPARAMRGLRRALVRAREAVDDWQLAARADLFPSAVRRRDGCRIFPCAAFQYCHASHILPPARMLSAAAAAAAARCFRHLAAPPSVAHGAII